jgi:hypothetical protein
MDALRDHHFTSDHELKEAVHTWLSAKTIFSKGIHKLSQCQTKCIEEERDYVEK